MTPTRRGSRAGQARIPRRSLKHLVALWRGENTYLERSAIRVLSEQRRAFESLSPQLPLRALRGNWPVMPETQNHVNLTEHSALAIMSALSLPGPAIADGEYQAWLAWSRSDNSMLGTRELRALLGWSAGLEIRQMHLTGNASDLPLEHLPDAGQLATALGHLSPVLDDLGMLESALVMFRRLMETLEENHSSALLADFLYARHYMKPKSDLYADAAEIGWTDPWQVHGQLRRAGHLLFQPPSQLLPPSHRPARWNDALAQGLIAQTADEQRLGKHLCSPGNEELCTEMMDELLRPGSLADTLRLAARKLNEVTADAQQQGARGAHPEALKMAQQAAAAGLFENTAILMPRPELSRLLWLLTSGRPVVMGQWPRSCARALLTLARETGEPGHLSLQERQVARDLRFPCHLPENPSLLLAAAMWNWQRQWGHYLNDPAEPGAPGLTDDEYTTLRRWAAQLQPTEELHACP